MREDLGHQRAYALLDERRWWRRVLGYSRDVNDGAPRFMHCRLELEEHSISILEFWRPPDSEHRPGGTSDVASHVYQLAALARQLQTRERSGAMTACLGRRAAAPDAPT
jgi:hypothetical protein